MSAYYENNASWSAPARQPSWEQQAPPSRSGTASASREEQTAFSAQFEEIDRATDNLVKSGKWMMGAPGQGMPNPRRESMPPAMGGRPPYQEFDPRMGGGASRHHSVSEYDGMRSGSAGGLQNFYASQRFQAPPPPRANEAEQMMQAKRRMAAQRERELRNYHQEQQYNRNISGVKSDRSMSPNTMSEDERRELIARQHRALYGNDSTLYNPDGTPLQQQVQQPRRQSQDVRVGSVSSAAAAAGARGASPLAFDPFGTQSQSQVPVQAHSQTQSQIQSHSGVDSAVQMPSRDGRVKSPSSATSPTSNPTTFGLIDNAQQSSRTSVSSPSGSGSPPLVQGAKQNITTGGVAPIGTRPAQAGPVQNLNKRSTTPLPSPLSFGFSAAEQQAVSAAERSTSSASNPTIGGEKSISGLGASWGSNSGTWGAPKSGLGVQASVWG